MGYLCFEPYILFLNHGLAILHSLQDSKILSKYAKWKIIVPKKLKGPTLLNQFLACQLEYKGHSSPIASSILRYFGA